MISSACRPIESLTSAAESAQQPTNVSRLSAAGLPISQASAMPISHPRTFHRLAASISRLFPARAAAVIGFLLCFFHGQARADITTGLLTHYSFENTTQDLSGNNNHATLVDPASSSYSTSGGVGAGLLLSGGAVEAKPDIALPRVTVALWIRPTTVPSGTNFTADNWIVDGWKGRENYGIYLQGNKVWAAFHKINTGEIHVQSDAAIVAGTLYHVAMTFDGINLKLYVNGTLQADQKSSPGGEDIAGPTPTDLRLGMNRSGTQRYQGLMDEFRLYDRALPVADIQSLNTTTTTQQTRTIRLENIGAVDSYVKSTLPGVALGVKPETRTGGTGDESRLLLQFPTVGFPATVSKATLFLYCKGNNNAGAGNAPLALYTPTAPWTNAVTWNNQPTATQIAALPGTPAGGQWLAIEITAQLSGWLAGGTNNGIELRSTGTTNQENVFASLESAIHSERPYLSIDYTPPSNLIWSEEFNGNGLDTANWSITRGGASVNGGIATVSGGWSGEISTAGKKTFRLGDFTTTFEFRLKRNIIGGDAALTLFDNSAAANNIGLLETSWSVGTGMRLYSDGVFGQSYQGNGNSTGAWKEYRLVVNGSQLTGSRGDSLANLNETLSKTLAVTTSGRSFSLALTNGQNNPADFDWIRVYGPRYSVEGTIAYAGGGSGKVLLFSGASTTTAPTLGAYRFEVFPGAQQLWAYLDTNDNAQWEPWEPLGRYSGPALNVTTTVSGINFVLTLPADGDNDGMSDEWELANGLNSAVNDAAADLDGDGLTNAMEYRLQTQVGDSDSDSDGVPDGQEFNLAGSNPLLADTDGDSMADGWEIANGLNPLLNDAANDRDLDGLTNKEEFDQRAAGYKANGPNSKAGLAGDDGLSDYRRLKGEGWVHHRYDKNDRLTATERDTGLVQLYVYDGNSQKARDVLQTRLDADADTLPDAWEFANALATTGSTAAFGDNGPSGDPDRDGFNNFQEWNADTDPRSLGSFPTSGRMAANSSTITGTIPNPTSWKLAVGQIDGFGNEEVLVAADGDFTAAGNSVAKLTNTAGSWTRNSYPIGNTGVTSLKMGQLNSSGEEGILAGLATSTGPGTVKQMAFSGDTLVQSQAIFTSGSGNPKVLDLANGVTAIYGTTAGGAGNLLFRTSWSNGVWGLPVNAGSAAAGTPTGVLIPNGIARWLSSTRLEYSALNPIPAGAINRPGTKKWFFQSPSEVVWAQAEAYAVQWGGHLATVPDAATNSWLATLPFGGWIGMTYYRSSATLSRVYEWSSGAPVTFLAPSRQEIGDGSLVLDYRVGFLFGGTFWDGFAFNSNLGGPYFKGICELDRISLPIGAEVGEAGAIMDEGSSLSWKRLRPTSSEPESLICAYIADANADLSAGPGDFFVLKEISPTPTQPAIRSESRIPITLSSSKRYALTTLSNGLSDVRLFIGEPDGTVSLWTAPDATSPLVRKVFTTEFRGKVWHQMEPLKELDGREGLVGLLVDPAVPNACQVIHWSPEAIEAALNGTAPVLNHAPLARVLPTPASGAGRSPVAVRLWDAEAHSSALALQYQRPGETTWSPATLLSVNGGPASSAATLATQPGGQTHSLVWNAAQNLGLSFNGIVFLRTQATDAESGAWSDPMPYAVNTAADLDTDGDGFTDGTEAAFGTNPNLAGSIPAVQLTLNPNGSLSLTWPTAAGRTYRIQTSTNLSEWTPLSTVYSTGTATLPAPVPGVDRKRYYRIAAE